MTSDLDIYRTANVLIRERGGPQPADVDAAGLRRMQPRPVGRTPLMLFPLLIQNRASDPAFACPGSEVIAVLNSAFGRASRIPTTPSLSSPCAPGFAPSECPELPSDSSILVRSGSDRRVGIHLCPRRLTQPGWTTLARSNGGGPGQRIKLLLCPPAGTVMHFILIRIRPSYAHGQNGRISVKPPAEIRPQNWQPTDTREREEWNNDIWDFSKSSVFNRRPDNHVPRRDQSHVGNACRRRRYSGRIR